jgi:hypothetical protein
MSWSLVQFVEGRDAGKYSVVSSGWLIQAKKGPAVHWRAGKKPWKSYPAVLLFQGKKISTTDCIGLLGLCFQQLFWLQ